MGINRKRAQVIRLATEDKTGMLWETTWGQLMHTHTSGVFRETYTPFHLYFVTDEKSVLKSLKDDDWVIETSNNNLVSQFSEQSLNQRSMGCKKIIATTDPSLCYLHDNGVLCQGITHLPQPSQSFIESYCKNPVDRVLVEYEWLLGNEEDENRNLIPELYLKLTSNNEVIIYPTKNSWTRDEVEVLLNKVVREFDKPKYTTQIKRGSPTIGELFPMSKFFKENL